jgi:hypothetical protein
MKNRRDNRRVAVQMRRAGFRPVGRPDLVGAAGRALEALEAAAAVAVPHAVYEGLVTDLVAQGAPGDVVARVGQLVEWARKFDSEVGPLLEALREFAPLLGVDPLPLIGVAAAARSHVAREIFNAADYMKAGD